jgi:hypothetical protein
MIERASAKSTAIERCDLSRLEVAVRTDLTISLRGALCGKLIELAV